MNETLALHMPEVLARLQQAPLRLAYPMAALVGRLLCTDSRFHHDCVLEAAREHLFRLDGCRALLFEIGMGPGSGLKLLLDVAQWAAEQKQPGALEYACTALWGASQILQRHYEDHPTLRQVLLYRLPYLSGPVFLWTLRMVQSRQGVSLRYSSDRLLEFIEDIAPENPGLAEELTLSVHDPEAANAVEFQSRLQRLESLCTTPARAAALRTLGPLPAGLSLKRVNQITQLLLRDLDNPQLRPHILDNLRRIVESPAGVPTLLHDLVEERQDDLPEELRRLYLQAVPDCPHLQPVPPKYWQSDSRVDPYADLEELYRAGLSRAVDDYRAQQEVANDYARRLSSRTPLMAAADTQQLQHWLDQGHDPNELNKQGWSALMFAAEAGEAEMVELLLQNQARPDLRDAQSRSAFTEAARAGHLAVLDVLLAHVDESEVQEAFRQALSAGPEAGPALNQAVLDWTLAHGADPDTLEEDGRTPLIQAVLAQDLPLTARLLEAGACPHHRDRQGHNALHYAQQSNHPELLALLKNRPKN